MTPAPWLANLELRPPASNAAIEKLEADLGARLPSDYRELLCVTDGVEGALAGGRYVALWSAGDVLELNEAYAVDEFVPGVTLIGTDGGNTGYGFQTTKDGTVTYVAVPLVGMEPNAVQELGSSISLLAGA